MMVDSELVLRVLERRTEEAKKRFKDLEAGSVEWHSAFAAVDELLDARIAVCQAMIEAARDD